MRLRLRILLLASPVAVLAGEYVHGQTIYEPYDPGSGDKLVTLAAEQHELIERRGLRYVDSQLQALLDRVAGTVLPTVADDYIDFRVYLIRDPSPISFSLADGQIYIHTGLLARLQSEGQLAAVIAHEAHHVAAHDHFSADKARRGKATALGFFGTAAGIGAFAATVSQSLRTRFGEDTEMDADAHAVELIANAGYRKMAALQVLDLILRDPELVSPDISGLWTTVTEMEQRRAALQALIGADESAAGPSQALVLTELVDMTIDDYIRLDRAGTAVEWIDALIEVRPDAFLYAAKGDAHVALGPRPHHITEGLTESEIRKLSRLTRAEIDEKYLATAEGKTRYRENTDMAISAYTEAIRRDENNARAHAGLGQVYFSEGNYRPAAQHLVTYLKLKPDAVDRHLVLEKLQHISNELRIQKEKNQ